MAGEPAYHAEAPGYPDGVGLLRKASPGKRQFHGDYLNASGLGESNELSQQRSVAFEPETDSSAQSEVVIEPLLQRDGHGWGQGWETAFKALWSTFAYTAVVLTSSWRRTWPISVRFPPAANILEAAV